MLSKTESLILTGICAVITIICIIAFILCQLRYSKYYKYATSGSAIYSDLSTGAIFDAVVPVESRTYYTAQ